MKKFRTLLGKFLFSGDTVFKQVAALSGEVKKPVLLLRKCSYVQLIYSFLDLEPTNHLDIPAKEMLEEAIQNYDSTVIVVSTIATLFLRPIKLLRSRWQIQVCWATIHYYLDKGSPRKNKQD